jgi:hypothetical protein
MKAQDSVARFGRRQRAGNNGLHDEKRLAGPCAAGKAGIALRAFEKTPCLLLACAEYDHPGLAFLRVFSIGKVCNFSGRRVMTIENKKAAHKWGGLW